MTEEINIKLIEEKMSEAEKRFWLSIDSIAQEVFYQKVYPFCQKRNWKFLSGNGTYFLGPYSDMSRVWHSEKFEDDQELLEIIEFLDHEIPGTGQCLGSYMDCIQDHMLNTEVKG